MDLKGRIAKAGAYVLTHGRFIFMVGPTEAGDRLGIVRLGGHREGTESSWECAQREVLEEASVRIRPLRPPATYWAEAGRLHPTLRPGPWPEEGIPPLVVFTHGSNPNGPLTVLYLATTDDPPAPDMEAHGLLLLSQADLKRLAVESLTLKQYLAAGGQAVLQEDVSPSLPLEPFYHLHALTRIVDRHPEIMAKC